MTAVAAPPLRAFHGSVHVKRQYLARLDAHAAADEIVKGQYWENGKGCAVGCTIHDSDHTAYERELGLPTWLARLEDGMFEAMQNGEAKAFPLRFLTVIPVGADVSGVRDQFLAWLMDDPTYGTAHTAPGPEIKALAAEVARRLRAQEDVTGPLADDLTAKLRAAWAAWAARDARGARGARGARDARDAWDARDARDAWDAWAAWAARDARDARDAFVKASAEELLRLLAEAPVLVAIPTEDENNG